MIYDHELVLCTLEGGSTPLQGKLKPVRVCPYSPMEVWHRRFWESVQANSRIDKMACIRRFPDDNISATMWCELSGHVYHIEQAQEGVDPDDGHQVYFLSLRREEANYDIAGL